CSTLMDLPLAMIVTLIPSPAVDSSSIRHDLTVDAAAAGLQRGHLDVAPLRHRARRILMLQGIKRRPYHIGGIGGSDRCRDHGLHPERGEYRAHRPADDDQRGKAEAAAALHHLRHTIDVDELVDELARLLPLAGAGAGAIAVSFIRHSSSSRSGSARSLSAEQIVAQNFNPASRAASP